MGAIIPLPPAFPPAGPTGGTNAGAALLSPPVDLSRDVTWPCSACTWCVSSDTRTRSESQPQPQASPVVD
jgi:hypothetical protein